VALASDDITICSPENTRTPGGYYTDFVITKKDSSYCSQIIGQEQQDHCFEIYEFCEQKSPNWCGRE